MAALAGEVGGGFALIAFEGGVGAVGEEEFDQVAAVGDGGGEEGCESASLGGVDGGAVLEQEQDGVRVFAEGEGGVEGMVLLGVVAEGVDWGIGG